MNARRLIIASAIPYPKTKTNLNLFMENLKIQARAGNEEQKPLPPVRSVSKRMRSAMFIGGIATGILAGMLFIGNLPTQAYPSSDKFTQKMVEEQIREEKAAYIDLRQVQEGRVMMEARITVDALARVREEVQESNDPASIDIEARVRELTDF